LYHVFLPSKITKNPRKFYKNIRKTPNFLIFSSKITQKISKEFFFSFDVISSYLSVSSNLFFLSLVINSH
ncbi:MAG: hypothetical protein KBT03_04345, partial [Bacteroidales bacterium]|nr:hypothetical protein [Candidatus Scybalousia scybalohippi]